MNSFGRQHGVVLELGCGWASPAFSRVGMSRLVLWLMVYSYSRCRGVAVYGQAFVGFDEHGTVVSGLSP
jgi:hypothetical protein